MIDWTEVTTGRPCPVCGAESGCRFNSAGAAALCGNAPPEGQHRRPPTAWPPDSGPTDDRPRSVPPRVEWFDTPTLADLLGECPETLVILELARRIGPEPTVVSGWLWWPALESLDWASNGRVGRDAWQVLRKSDRAYRQPLPEPPAEGGGL